jgi:hypothetical protein
VQQQRAAGDERDAAEFARADAMPATTMAICEMTSMRLIFVNRNFVLIG